MNRNESSRLGDLQSEGNLGNERNRRSVGGSGREHMRNWIESESESVSSGSGSSRDSEERGSEEWGSGDSDSSASRRSSR